MDRDIYMADNVTLQELAGTHELSLRAFNVCNDNGLTDLKKILIYFNKEGDFSNLKNCGRKTDLELTNICQQYLKLVDFNPGLKTVASQNKFHDLTGPEEIYLNRYFHRQIKKLSTRSQNAINSLFYECNKSLFELYSHLEKTNFNFSKIKSIGRKSSEEIEWFFNNFFSVSDLIKKVKKHELYFEVFLSFLEKKSINNYQQIEEWLKKHQHEFEGMKFPLFPFISEIINQGVLLDERRTFVLNNLYNRDKSSDRLTYEEVGEKFGVTRERIRQLSTHEKLMAPFLQDIKEILLELGKDRIDFSGIKVDFNDTLIIIDTDFINTESLTNFSTSFIYQILDVLTDEHELLFNDESESKYLVNKEILGTFDLRGILSKLKSMLNSKIEKDFHINLKGLIFEYLPSKEHIERIDEYVFLSERIIFEEFGIFADINGELTIEKTVKTPVYEYIIEVLRSRKEPMHIDEIFSELEKNRPGVTKSPDAIRSHILRYSNLFINTEWSTYGLKEWERAGLYIGGSIKDLVEMYLDKFDEPKHIFEVAEFVTKHRDTSLSSIYGNLQSDPHERFILFGYGFVGLNNKNYDPESTKFKGIPPHTFRGFKKKFFKNGKSIYSYEEIVSLLANKFSLKEVQIRASLEQRIANNSFTLKNDYLIISNYEHKVN